jgi:hypothetical protein
MLSHINIDLYYGFGHMTWCYVSMVHHGDVTLYCIGFLLLVYPLVSFFLS